VPGAKPLDSPGLGGKREGGGPRGKKRGAVREWESISPGGKLLYPDAGWGNSDQGSNQEERNQEVKSWGCEIGGLQDSLFNGAAGKETFREKIKST